MNDFFQTTEGILLSFLVGFLILSIALFYIIREAIKPLIISNEKIKVLIRLNMEKTGISSDEIETMLKSVDKK